MHLVLKFSGVLIIATSQLCAESMGADKPRNGLNVEYFADESLTQSVAKQVAPNIEFNWGEARPHPACPADHFSIRWTGWINLRKAEEVRLMLEGDGGFRLYLDERLLIDNWNGKSTRDMAKLRSDGNSQKIVIEYRHDTGDAWLAFSIQHSEGAKYPWIVEHRFLTQDEESSRINDPSRGPHFAQGPIRFLQTLPGEKTLTGFPNVFRLEGHLGDWGESSVRKANYVCYLVPPKTGRYTLKAFGDDVAIVSLDKKTVVRARNDRNGGKAEATLDLKEKTAYLLEVNTENKKGRGSFYLHWITPDGDQEECIPPECIFGPAEHLLPQGVKPTPAPSTKPKKK